MLIDKFSEFRTDDKFLVVALLYAAYDLSIDTETLRYLDDLLRMLWGKIHLHTMTHIEHLIHLCPVSTALLMNSLEEWRNREKVVLDHAAVVTDEMKDLCLCTA